MSTNFELQRQVAADASRKVYRRPAQIRRAFVGRPQGVDGPNPLALMLRGGRGGQVRLKLYLSLLWIGSGEPHTVTAPARSWATLLGLEDPDGNGARRVRAAIEWLTDRRFIKVDAPLGRPMKLTLLRETGTGERYSVPGAAISEARREGRPDNVEDRYLQLPASFWESGWIAALTGPAVAMLLVLLHARGNNGREIWFSPSVARMTYGLSVDTRSAGVHELADYNVIAINRRLVAPGALAHRRVRNTYSLYLDRLTEHPPTERPTAAFLVGLAE